MTERPLHSLDQLAADPALAAGLPEPVRLRLLAAAEGVAAVLRLQPTAPSENGAKPRPGEMLTAQAAAALAGVTVEQFYRRRRFRSAVVKLGHRTVRVDERKLRRILAETEC